MKRDALTDLHPVCGALYLAGALVLTMFFLHPVLLLASLTGAAAYASSLYGGREIRKRGRAWLPFLILILLSNPLLTHRGVTVLFTLPTGNAVTLQSLLFGAASAGLFLAVLLWLSCMRRVIDSDRWLYLFGRAVPALSLLLSMAFRQVPRYAGRFREVYRQQRDLERTAAGADRDGKASGSRPSAADERTASGKRPGLVRAVSRVVRTFSIVTTWALEESVERSDSMAARGYGLRRRTAYGTYRMTRRDGLFLACWAMLAAGIAVLAWRGFYSYWFYPAAAPLRTDLPHAASYVPVFVYYLLPAVMQREEERRWKVLQSGI